MDSKRWWCLLSKNHRILNLKEFFHSEKYRAFTQHAAVAILRHSATMGYTHKVSILLWANTWHNAAQHWSSVSSTIFHSQRHWLSTVLHTLRAYTYCTMSRIIVYFGDIVKLSSNLAIIAKFDDTDTRCLLILQLNSDLMSFLCLIQSHGRQQQHWKRQRNPLIRNIKWSICPWLLNFHGKNRNWKVRYLPRKFNYRGNPLLCNKVRSQFSNSANKIILKVVAYQAIPVWFVQKGSFDISNQRILLTCSMLLLVTI